MPIATVILRPGVNTQRTLASNEAGVSVSNLIRYKDQIIQKTGGWDQFYSGTYGSTIRAIHGWQGLTGTGYLAVATTGSTGALNVITAGSNTDITPQTNTTDKTPNFSISSAAPGTTVTVVASGSSASVYDTVYFDTPVAVGNLLLNGAYPVSAAIDSTSFQIQSSVAASTTIVSSGILPIFATTANSATVTVTLPNHNFSAIPGLFQQFIAPTTVTGLTIQGPYEVNSVIDSTSFTITAANQSTGTGTGTMNSSGNDSYTKVLLHMDGVDASTTFTDSNVGGSAHAWTAAGDAQIDTADFEFGGASGLFDGTGDFISTPDSADFTLGSSDFTIDCWFKCTAAGGVARAISGQGDDAFTLGTAAFIFRRETSNVMAFYVRAISGSPLLTGTTQFTNVLNTGWHHTAVVRNGSTWKLYIDGVSESSATDSTAVTDSANNLYVGQRSASFDPWIGWIDEFRLSVGIARWTSNFTPPTNPYGGLAELKFYIALGPPSGAGGYGIGGYGLGGYGLGSPVPAGTGTPITATDWTLANWGEALLGCPYGGAIYVWSPKRGFQTAQVIPQAPFFNGGIFVSQPQQILVAWASDQSTGTQDPLQVKWSDSANYANWTISNQTAAGAFHIPTGSKIMGALQGPQQGVIWTDVDVWAMQYVGGTVIFNFTRIGSGCGLIGTHAAGVIAGTVYWCSNAFQFFRLGTNGVEPVPCTVWDFIFQNLSAANQTKIVCAPNSVFNEITWYFPSSASAGENDSYVKYNIVEGEWDYGTLSRNAWIDVTGQGSPIAANTTTIYQHEIGYDNVTQPLNPVFESGYWSIAEGNEMAFVDWVLPDMKFGTYSGAKTASVQISFKVTDYAGDTPTVFGPYTFTQATEYISTRFRGRFMAIRIESADAGSWWRIGAVKYRWARAGRR